MAAKKRQENALLKNGADDFAHTFHEKTLGKIVVSLAIFEINAFLCFTQKFKMVTKNGRKTLSQKWDIRLSLFSRYVFFAIPFFCSAF